MNASTREHWWIRDYDIMYDLVRDTDLSVARRATCDIHATQDGTWYKFFISRSLVAAPGYRMGQVSVLGSKGHLVSVYYYISCSYPLVFESVKEEVEQLIEQATLRP